MIVERIWAANELRNYHYVVACGETGDALVIDPLDWRACLERARERNWTITQIVNTHEHRDHTAGNAGLVAATGAKVMAHARGAAVIGGVDRGLAAGDVIRVGRSVELECLDTPGHTLAHVCLLAHADGPALFSGDTLFNAGAGNCHHGGHPAELYKTFSEQLARLPPSTLVYPGHDYIENNLRFTLDREPDNRQAEQMLGRLEGQDPSHAYVSTLDAEMQVNTFFRLTSPTVIARLRVAFPDLPDQPDPRTVFLKLRELRNKW